MKDEPTITIIGGGSVAWTPHVVRDMLLTESLSSARYVLYDIDKAAAQLTRAYLTKVARRVGAKAKFVATDRKATAFRGADYIVITISTGGLNAMAHDIRIPEQFGIYHTVGDTSGPGGWARFIRNFDVFADLARDFKRHCPRAMVLNYTNPMTTLTDLLCRLHDGPVVGLCHGLFENLQFIKDFYGLDSEDRIKTKYAGINHFFWMTEVRAGDIDIVADLNRRLKRQSFTDLLAKVHRDAMGFASPKRELATELMRLCGIMPYLGDRHTCEFFPQYITRRANMKKYKLVRTSIAERRKMFRDNRARLVRQVKGELDEESLVRSRETAADIIDAHLTGRRFTDVGNVPNVGQVSNLPRGAVVETAVRVTGDGFKPIRFGALPDVPRAFIEPWINVFTMVVDAMLAGDQNRALTALRLDPTCAHLDTDQIRGLGLRLLRAHRKYIRSIG